MSFDTVDLLTGKVFQVTWDLGRRCNYDCSYCVWVPGFVRSIFRAYASKTYVVRSVGRDSPAINLIFHPASLVRESFLAPLFAGINFCAG